jgi:hypothetical protein
MQSAHTHKRILHRLSAVLIGALFLSAHLPPAQVAASGDGQPLPSAQTATPAQATNTWDDRFGVPGIPDGVVEAIAINDAGDTFVAGLFNIPSVGAKTIARWDGRRWHALGGGLSYTGLAYVNDLAVSGASVYAVGAFTDAGNIGANRIARWDGAAWHNVGNGVGPKRRSEFGIEDGELNAVAVGPDGSVYVAGHFNEIDGVPAFSVARWDGQQWRALGMGLTNPGFSEGTLQESRVYALAIGADGVLYAGGEFLYAGEVTANSVARWDGNAWSAFGGGVTTDNGISVQPGIVRAIALNGANVFAGGQFNRADGAPAANIAGWNGSGWSALGAGVSAQFESEPVLRSLMMAGQTLIAGGTFTRAGNVAMRGIARWDGQAWSPMAEPLVHDFDVEVHALARAANGEFFAGGRFTGAGADKLVFNIARWTGTRWANLGEGISNYSDSPADVLVVATDDEGNVYAGGQMKRAGGLAVKEIAMWDGVRWHDMAGGVSGGSGLVYAILPLGDDIYVAGSFSQAGSVAASNIAKWNRTTGAWSALAGGIDGAVSALAFGDGKLYAGGAFTRAGTATALDVAVWDGQAWSGLGGDYEIFEIFSNGAEAGTYVNALVYDQGELFIGGHFQTIHRKGTSTALPSNYSVVHNLVSYRFNDQAWLVLGSLAAPGVTTDGFSGLFTSVNTMAIVGNALFVGGEFNRAGNVAAQSMARYDIAANTWAAVGNLGGGVEKLTVRALSAYGADVYVAGAFTSIGAMPVRYAAKFNTTQGTWSALGDGMAWYNDRFTRAQAVHASDYGVYFGGKFDHAGPHPALGIARWSGAFTPPPPPPPPPPPTGSYKVMLPLVIK